jgi:hypothetical protein
MGGGVAGGAQIVGHALRAGMTAEPSLVMAHLDWRYALNSLSRQKMMNAVAQRCKEILPLAVWAYQAHSRLHVRGRPGAAILSMHGVRQGDPLGPLFFALTMQGPLEKLQQLALPARPVAYADDTFLQGSAAGITAAFPILCDLAEPLGLEVVLAKCAAHSVDAAAGEAVAADLGIRHAPAGLLAACSPVRTPLKFR